MAIELTAKRLWQGSQLRTIAHAVFLAHTPELENEVSWDGHNHSVQNSQGVRGTVTFFDDEVVAAFFDVHSDRNPFINPKNSTVRWEQYFDGAPDRVKRVAESDTLQYLLDIHEGHTLPIITTGFWSENGILRASEPFELVFANGGHLIDNYLHETKDAITAWKQDYHLNNAQVDLIEKLLNKHLAHPKEWVHLSIPENEALVSFGKKGLKETSNLLASIYIRV